MTTLPREKAREYQRVWRAKHPKQARETQRKWIERNREHFYALQRKWNKEHTEKVKESREKYRLAHPEDANEQAKHYRKTHREQRSSHYKLTRDFVLAHYGNKCSCCGESTREFLGIDHINGKIPEQKHLGGQSLCAWLIKNNFPEGFQVLCHNCNCAKGFYGICPHKKEKEK